MIDTSPGHRGEQGQGLPTLADGPGARRARGVPQEGGFFWWFSHGENGESMGKPWENGGFYHLVNVYITMENHHFWVNQRTFDGHFQGFFGCLPEGFTWFYRDFFHGKNMEISPAAAREIQREIRQK